MNDKKLLRPKEVAKMLGVTITTLNRYAQRPDFPKKVSLSARHTGYYLDELITYLERYTRTDKAEKGGKR